jgi:RNA 2',3'-cyclic 3'-phosphodiesterase
MFAAVVPPPEVVEDLDAFLEVRRSAAPFRWAGAEQLHMTLAFYADVPERSQDELVERLERAAERRTPFAARIAGGGAFPHVAGARVLWAGLATDDEELDRLATGARAAASRSGVAVDGQRFRPHVTVARLGHPADVSAWVEVLDAYDGPAWTVDTVTLLASYLGEGPRGRPRYEVVAELPLG